jgi:hypothetical protein
MHDSNCASTLADEILASLKSMTKNRFSPMMIKYVSFQDRFLDCNRDLVFVLSRVITHEILGHAGKYRTTGDDEEDEENAESEKLQKDQRPFDKKIDAAVASWRRKRGKNLSVKNKDLVAKVKDLNLDDMRAEFLPAYFQSLVTDDKRQPGWKAALFPDKIFLILRFFSDVNELSKLEKSHQLLFPSANTRSRHVQLTNTILANIWTGYIQTRVGEETEKDQDWIQTLPSEFLFVYQMSSLFQPSYVVKRQDRMQRERNI